RTSGRRRRPSPSSTRPSASAEDGPADAPTRQPPLPPSSLPAVAPPSPVPLPPVAPPLVPPAPGTVTVMLADSVWNEYSALAVSWWVPGARSSGAEDKLPVHPSKQANTSASSTVSTKLEAWSSKQPQSSHEHDCSTSTV